MHYVRMQLHTYMYTYYCIKCTACMLPITYMEKTKNGLNIYWRDIIEKKGADYFFLLCLMSHVVSSNEK